MTVNTTAVIGSGIYRQRRERLAAAMQAGVAIVPTAPERTRNRDNRISGGIGRQERGDRRRRFLTSALR